MSDQGALLGDPVGLRAGELGLDLEFLVGQARAAGHQGLLHAGQALDVLLGLEGVLEGLAGADGQKIGGDALDEHVLDGLVHAGLHLAGQALVQVDVSGGPAEVVEQLAGAQAFHVAPVVGGGLQGFVHDLVAGLGGGVQARIPGALGLADHMLGGLVAGLGRLDPLVGHGQIMEQRLERKVGGFLGGRGAGREQRHDEQADRKPAHHKNPRTDHPSPPETPAGYCRY